MIALAVLGVLVSVQTDPTQDPAKSISELLRKALDAYSTAKSYQGKWSYTLAHGTATQKMLIDVKTKTGGRLLFRLAPAPGQKSDGKLEPIPELHVVLDGKTAWFVNSSERTYFQVPLPKDPRISPLAFFPMMSMSAQPRRGADATVDGKSAIVIEGTRSDGSTMRAEIDPATSRVRRIITEAQLGLQKSVATLSMDKETFDGELADSVFEYRAPRGYKQVPTPPGAGALFGT